MSKKVLVASLCLIAFFSNYFMSNEEKRPVKTLTVGMMSGWAPFMSVNDSGNYEGFDVDVAKALSERLGAQLVIKDLGSLASCFIALQQNSVDLVLSGLDITQKRLETMNMVPYLGKGFKEYYLVFWNEIPAGVLKLEDLKNIQNPVVCVEPGNSPEKFLDRYDYITKKQLSSLSDIVLDLGYGKSLAAFLEPQVVKRLSQIRPEIVSLAVPLPEEFQVFGYGIALQKKNTVLTNAITSIIQQLRTEGLLQQLETKWKVDGV